MSSKMNNVIPCTLRDGLIQCYKIVINNLKAELSLNHHEDEHNSQLTRGTCERIPCIQGAIGAAEDSSLRMKKVSGPCYSIQMREWTHCYTFLENNVK